MSSRTALASIGSQSRRATLSLLLLAAAILLLIRSSANDFAYVPDATVFDGSEASEHFDTGQSSHIHTADDDDAYNTGSSKLTKVPQRQTQHVKGPPSGHQLQEEEGQWDWDWVKKVTAEKLKSSFGWRGEEDDRKSHRIGHHDQQSQGIDEAEHGTSSLSYHEHLDKEHSPHSYLRHSPTLTFGHIYVLSLPHRTDRRSRMSRIARALGFQFTFVDATSKEAPLIGWIAERVKEIRDLKRKILALALNKAEEEIGGLGTSSIWLKGNDTKLGLSFPDLRGLDHRWTVDSPATEHADAKGAIGKEATHYSNNAVDWVSYLEYGHHASTLQSSDPTVIVTDLLHDPVEPLEARQVNDGVIATWYSQTRVWKKIVENNDASALIMEDDIDIEWDIERTWPNVERALPKDWEIVFLGHCWGRELANPHYVHPALHQANEPRCLHGYVLSQRGAQHLLEIFSDPWRAYQTPVDTFMPYLTRTTPIVDALDANNKKDKATSSTGTAEGDSSNDHIRAFSMEPPVIIQSKELSSDIQEGIGSTWRGLLADSTWDRILRDEGQYVKQLNWDDIKSDPAIKPRPWVDLGRKKKAKKPAVEKLGEVSQMPNEEKSNSPSNDVEIRKVQQVDSGEAETKSIKQQHNQPAGEIGSNRHMERSKAGRGPSRLKKDKVPT